MDLDGYLDDLEVKIARLQSLLEGAKVIETNYTMVNQYINSFQNGTFIDGTLADTIFDWIECSDDEKIKRWVKSSFYKHLKDFVSTISAARLSSKQGLMFVAEQLDIFGKEVREVLLKHFVDGINKDTLIEVYGYKFAPMIMSYTVMEKIFPDSEFTKIYGKGIDWAKSFTKGGITQIADFGAGILSLPNHAMFFIDERDNIIVSGAEYIRHNGIKTLDEDSERRAKDILKKIDAFKDMQIKNITEQVKNMTVDDAFFAAGYVTTFILTAEGIKEVVESVKAIKATKAASVGGETVEGSELVLGELELADEAGIKTEQIVAKLEKLSEPSSRQLRKNLIDAGVEVPDYPNAAHHIVAGKSPKAETARKILLKYDIDINYMENGVFLPTIKDVGGAYHPSLHTNLYYDEVNSLLTEAQSRQDAIDILKYISESLKDGDFLK